MKKLISIILSVVLALSIAGCSGSEQTFEVSKLVNKDGKEFVADLTKTGMLEEMKLSSTSFELCGKTYELPLKISDLLNDGWVFVTQFKNEFKPKTRTSLISFSLKNADGATIDFGELYNDTDEVQKIEDCWLTKIEFSSIDVSTSKVDFVLPGGIVKASTAGDVASKYGDPNGSELFVDYSYSLEKQLSYNKHKDSGMSFVYVFKEDGTLIKASMSADIEQSFSNK